MRLFGGATSQFQSPDEFRIESMKVATFERSYSKAKLTTDMKSELGKTTSYCNRRVARFLIPLHLGSGARVQVTWAHLKLPKPTFL